MTDETNIQMPEEIAKFIEAYSNYGDTDDYDRVVDPAIVKLKEKRDGLYYDLTVMYNLSSNFCYTLAEIVFPEMSSRDDEIEYFENRIAKAKRIISLFTGETREKLDILFNALTEKASTYNWSESCIVRYNLLSKEELELFKTLKLTDENNPCTAEKCEEIVRRFNAANNELTSAVLVSNLSKILSDYEQRFKEIREHLGIIENYGSKKAKEAKEEYAARFWREFKQSEKAMDKYRWDKHMCECYNFVDPDYHHDMWH